MYVDSIRCFYRPEPKVYPFVGKMTLVPFLVLSVCNFWGEKQYCNSLCRVFKLFLSRAAISPESLKAGNLWYCSYIIHEFSHFEGLSRSDGARAGTWLGVGLEGAWVWVACPCTFTKPRQPFKMTKFKFIVCAVPWISSF